MTTRRDMRAPPASDLEAFLTDPLGHLAVERASLGDVFVVRESGPVFSGLADCSATVAVFGAAQLQQVLSDRERFVMPASSSARLALPSRLAQLNRSLHSLQDPQHGQHKRALAHLLGPAAVDEAGAQELLEQAVRDWAVQEPQPLLERMRDLSLCLAAHVLLGADVGPSLPRLMQSYFALRRQAASPANDDATALRRELLASGRALDRALRRHLRSTGSGGVFGRLLDPAATPGIAFDEGEAAGHANILFVSASEPVAVALTWTLLLLSQQGVLRRRLRERYDELDEVLLESLRMLPPNAFMARITTQQVQLAGRLLPAKCELMLCPLLAHREAGVFAEPRAFRPQRWREFRPSPYEFLPFGAGLHACVGRSMGMALLRTLLGFVLGRFDVLLDGDQTIDWRVHVQFMPRDDIRVRFQPAGSTLQGGRWYGPTAQLVDLDEDASAPPNSR